MMKQKQVIRMDSSLHCHSIQKPRCKSISLINRVTMQTLRRVWIRLPVRVSRLAHQKRSSRLKSHLTWYNHCHKFRRRLSRRLLMKLNRFVSSNHGPHFSTRKKRSKQGTTVTVLVRKKWQWPLVLSIWDSCATVWVVQSWGTWSSQKVNTGSSKTYRWHSK